MTILGGSRQESIKAWAATSCIRDELNYPHYSKEILQQVRFLKHRHAVVAEDDTRCCFRDGLLSRCQLPVDDAKYARLKADFDRTTFFLVEIASRKAYVWDAKQLYLHHIAEDPQYGFPGGTITVRDLTDAEIEDDLVELRKELHPRPLLVLSHVATYERGARYELACLLRTICDRLGIPFLDQGEIVRRHGEAASMLLPEPVLAHYTPLGHAVVGQKLAQAMASVVEDRRRPRKTQVYYTDKERVARHTFHGFGDYLRGCIHMYQRLGPDRCRIDFSHHPLNSVFCCRTYVPKAAAQRDVVYMFGQDHLLEQHDLVFTNNFPVREIDQGCRDFIVRHCLTPRLAFRQYVDETKRLLGLRDGEYAVIHIRAPDGAGFDGRACAQVWDRIKGLLTEPHLLLASHEGYLQNLNHPMLVKTSLSRCHVGHHEGTSRQTWDTMVEFMLMTTCKRVYQFSAYDWGSGFSNAMSWIYGIPVERM